MVSHCADHVFYVVSEKLRRVRVRRSGNAVARCRNHELLLRFASTYRRTRAPLRAGRLRVRQINETSTGCSWQKPVVAGRKFDPLSFYRHHPMHYITIIDPPTVATLKRRYEKGNEAKRRDEKKTSERIVEHMSGK